MNTSIIQEILSALAAPQEDFSEGAKKLLEKLGYHSNRTLAGQSGLVADFIDLTTGTGTADTAGEKALRENTESIKIIFQVTNNEIQGGDGANFDAGNTKSFVFMAVELKEGKYPRGKYVALTREINKRLSQATVVLFKTAENLLTLAFVNRRPHKRDPNRAVLGNVSLIKEISPADPHRAHLEILSELALEKQLGWMDEHNKQRNFDGWLEAWLDTLSTEELNRQFYLGLFNWFKRAVREAKFPTSQIKTLGREDHVIRLITRLLFIWFIKEKGLIAPDLFNENRIRNLLQDYDPDSGDSYYRAVLQNLFFATLNTEINKRGFSKRSNSTHRNFSCYRYKDEMSNPAELLALFKRTPFINGGLFDCLDSEEAASQGGYRIDCFTDNPKHRSEYSIPNCLFFDDNGLIPLFNHYKFTVEENTPAEQEVALDPELLGRVFENLLAAYNPETRNTVREQTARKQTGSYYTPRPVVDYMVSEVLVEALAEKSPPTDGDNKFWRERLCYLLDYEDAFNDAKDLFDKDEIDRLVQAIAEIRVLDPAVGSGAFPMGILHQLTLALRRLDSQNQRWRNLQKERAQARASDAFDTKDKEERNAELKEISDTFERYHDSDFGRKLYLIQNSIFGVDIQSLACQISKLRFFISLAIEQQSTEDHKDNYGIKPLPNLETRFVTANALLSLHKQQGVLTSEHAKNLQYEIQKNNERHYHAATREKKIKYRKKGKNLRQALATELIKIGMPGDAADKIAQWDPHDQNTSADWFDAEYMFGIAGGFNIVIGNPPYVESRNSLLSDEMKNSYIRQVFIDWNERLPRGSDLLIYFYARSAKFLNDSGCGCFITQNAWLNTNYGEDFQKFSIGKFSFQRIIDTSAKFFSDTSSQNINAVITIFLRKQLQNIEYGIANSGMSISEKRKVKARQTMKWGHLFSMPRFYEKILLKMRVEASNGSTITFGQGINPTKQELGAQGEGIPIIYKEAPQFVAISADRSVREVSRSRMSKIPALIMPRGIGDRYYCTFNSCKAFSYSGVELYIEGHLWESDLHYCLWAYLNSSFVWLFREITGRKNLGGGMLKAEATDMRALPIDFDFGFHAEAREVFKNLRKRGPLPVAEEIHTEEHLFIDNIVANYFDFTDMQENIRDALAEQVNFRLNKAKS